MTTKEIEKSRVALRNAGTLRDRNQLSGRTSAKLRDELEVLQQRKEAIRADYQRQLERWRTEAVHENVSVCAIPTDTQDSRLYRMTAVFALLSEMGLAAWIFQRLGVGWLFGVLTALFVTFTLHGVFLQIFNNPERPKETIHRIRRYAAAPAIVGFLLALALGMLARYVSGTMAVLLLPLFSLSLWLGTLSLIVLAASLFTLAHVLGWSMRHEKAYRKLDSQERASVAFLKELQHAGEIPDFGSLQLPQEASLLPDIKPNGGRAATLPIIALLAIALLSSAACSSAISPNPSANSRFKDAGTENEAQEVRDHAATLHIMIDWSGSCLRGAMEECWSTLRSELPAIIQTQHVTQLILWSFDSDGWCPKRLSQLPFPEPSVPTRSTLAPNEWDSFANIREAVRDAEDQEWMNRKKVAEDDYRKALQEALKPLDAVSVLPVPKYETRQSDIVGLLKRISETGEDHSQFIIVMTDLADTQHKELPHIPAPKGEVHVLLLLLPAQSKDALITIGKPLSGPEQFELRSRQVREAVPWAVPAPYFAKNLSTLFKPVR